MSTELGRTVADIAGKKDDRVREFLQDIRNGASRTNGRNASEPL